jgi:hypothetical protein
VPIVKISKSYTKSNGTVQPLAPAALLSMQKGRKYLCLAQNKIASLFKKV